MKAYKIPSQDYVILDEIQKKFVANSQGSDKQQGLLCVALSLISKRLFLGL